MAEHALSLGANAILAYPPTHLKSLRGVQQERAILEYHASLAGFNKPVILFYLYEEAGGVAYSDTMLDELLSMSEVVEIKIATLDSIVTFRNRAALRQKHPEK